MSPQEFETYLRRHVPLADFMQVSVVEASPDRCVVAAPLEPNLNVHSTFFGGSASALSLIAAWSLLQLRMTHEGLDARLVAHRNSITYLRPAAGAVTAEGAFADPAGWSAFVEALQTKGRARFAMTATMLFDGQPAARLEGDFVATRPQAMDTVPT